MTNEEKLALAVVHMGVAMKWHGVALDEVIDRVASAEARAAFTEAMHLASVIGKTMDETLFLEYAPDSDERSIKEVTRMLRIFNAVFARYFGGTE